MEYIRVINFLSFTLLSDEEPPKFTAGCQATQTVLVNNDNDKLSKHLVPANVTSSSNTKVVNTFLPSSKLEYGKEDLMRAFVFQQIAMDELGNKATCLSQILVRRKYCSGSLNMVLLVDFE